MTLEDIVEGGRSKLSETSISLETSKNYCTIFYERERERGRERGREREFESARIVVFNSIMVTL
jgi:hypothetical protein